MYVHVHVHVEVLLEAMESMVFCCSGGFAGVLRGAPPVAPAILIAPAPVKLNWNKVGSEGADFPVLE